MGWATGEQKIICYANDGRIAGRNTIWVQTALTTVVQMFKII